MVYGRKDELNFWDFIRPETKLFASHLIICSSIRYDIALIKSVSECKNLFKQAYSTRRTWFTHFNLDVKLSGIFEDALRSQAYALTNLIS